jgi:hypothetical protein
MQESLIRGWNSSAEHCCSSIGRILNDIPPSISSIKQLADLPQKEVPKLSDLVAELKQLMQEFEVVEFSVPDGTISVETDPVTLEDIYLGPFKVKLNLQKLSELYKRSAYDVIALDPHPAATSEEVTHPHVSNESLCEGDGSATIRSALEDGRLCDFFTLVKSILNTYSADSPYVSLSEWEGLACYSCGYICGGDNCYLCNFCEHDYCEECTTCCHECDETVCTGCVTRCSICDESICPNCVYTCSQCGSYCCRSCMEEDICKDCIESEVENEQRNDPVTTVNKATDTGQANTTGAKETNLATQETEPPCPEVQPDRLGQTRLLPG